MYTEQLLSSLNEQREVGRSGMCDVTLTVAGVNFPAHKCVLSAGISEVLYVLYCVLYFSHHARFCNNYCVEAQL